MLGASICVPPIFWSTSFCDQSFVEVGISEVKDIRILGLV